MSKKAVWITAGVLAVAGAAAAVAAVGDREGGFGHRFGDRGGNHDHRMSGEDGERRGGMRGGRRGWAGGMRSMSQEDFDARTRERFARLDKNSDGVIDAQEIEASFSERTGRRGRRSAGAGAGGGQGERQAQRMMTRLDTNNDGKVTREEFVEQVKKRFARMDLNNDGKITDEDLPPIMRGQDALKGEGGRFGRTGFGRGREGRGGGMLARMIAADANKDGVITLDEVLAAAGKRFDVMDRNKDGVVDKADFDAMRQQMAAYRVQRFLHRYGANKDGKVTREQFFNAAKERFAARDVNKDGRIDRSDRGGRGDRDGRRRRGGGGGGPGGNTDQGAPVQPDQGGPGRGPATPGQQR